MAEHMLQFGVFIDDDAIQQRVVDKIAEETVKKVEEEICDKKERKYGWGYESKNYIQKQADNIIEEKVKTFLNNSEIKEMIVAEAVRQIVASVPKTKAFKEAVANRVLLIPEEDLFLYEED